MANKFDQQPPSYSSQGGGPQMPQAAYQGYPQPGYYGPQAGGGGGGGGYYGQQGPQPGGYYQPGPPMGYYQQQPQPGPGMYGPPPPGGYYQQQGGYYGPNQGGGAGIGCLEALLASLACCCCLDCLLF